MEQELEIFDLDALLKMIDRNSGRITEIEDVKFNLYSIYLLNLHVYLRLDACERVDHPVVSKLRRLKKLVEKLEKEENIAEEANTARKNTRRMTHRMLKNKGHKEKFSKNNPRKKNRERAVRLLKKGEYKFDGNIDVSKSYSAKYL